MERGRLACESSARVGRLIPASQVQPVGMNLRDAWSQGISRSPWIGLTLRDRAKNEGLNQSVSREMLKKPAPKGLSVHSQFGQETLESFGLKYPNAWRALSHLRRYTCPLDRRLYRPLFCLRSCHNISRAVVAIERGIHHSSVLQWSPECVVGKDSCMQYLV